MMKPPLEYGKYYHIYNRGNNYEDIFTENSDYKHFLNIYDIYIHPVADTYAWCLMKNHFHILVRIKEEPEIGFLNSEHSKSEDLCIKWKTYDVENTDNRFNKKPIPGQQFKHLFNAARRNSMSFHSSPVAGNQDAVLIANGQNCGGRGQVYGKLMACCGLLLFPIL